MVRAPIVEEGELLDILGNETRRRILSLLANEPRYFSQLSKELGAPPQAVLRHLERLEEARLIASYHEAHSRGPERKYYQLNTSVYLTAGITGASVGFKVSEVPSMIASPKSICQEFERLGERVELAISLNDLGEVLCEARPLLHEIQLNLEELDRKKLELVGLRERLMSAVREITKNSVQEEEEEHQTLERRLVYALLSEDEDRISVEDLSEELDVREKEIERAFARLKARLSRPFSRLLHELWSE